MQYLSPSQIKKIAPAITRLPSTEENLVDTAAFLSHLGTLGYKPIVAVQGTPHSDAQTQSKGRHLAVASNRRGEIIAILNSHTVCRRAWLGAGYLVGNSEERGPEYLIGAVVPLPRWRGFEESLIALQGYQGSVHDASRALADWHPSIHQMRWMAKNLASTAYLPKHKTPLAKELLDVMEWRDDAPATAILAHMLRTARTGNLLPDAEPHPTLKPRKLKPIQSPDALFKAANAAFRTGVAAMAKYKVATYAFPSFNDRAESPAT